MSEELGYIAFEDKLVPGDWRVEFYNEETKEIFVTVFSGDDNERRAVEYAFFKNGKLPNQIVDPPLPKNPAPEPVYMQHDEFQIKAKTKAGMLDLVIRPNDLAWTYDAHRRTVAGKPKPPIERVVSGIANIAVKGKS